MQVEMNGGIIVTIAIILIGILATGLTVYYTRKAKEEKAQAASESDTPEA